MTTDDDTVTVRWVAVPGRGTPVLYLHGLGCSAGSSFSDTIARSGRAGALLDLVGHGLSERPAEFSYALDAHADVIAQVVPRLADGPVDVVAHSLGGSIAVLLAERHPELVRSSVLIEPGIDRVEVQPEDIAAWDEASWLRHGWEEQLAQREVPQRRAEMRLADPLAVLRSAVAITDAMGGTLHERLAATTVPTLLVSGYRDYPGADDYRRAGIRVERIDGGGHFVMNERPQEFAELVADFRSVLS